MHGRMNSLIVILVVFAVIVSSSIGAANAEKRIALVIGNNAYDNLPFNQQLLSAVNDARAVRKALNSLGFEVLIGENLGRDEFENKVFEFTGRINPGDIALFFYAGHGVNLGGGNYFLPSDIRPPQSARKGEERRLIKKSVWEQEVISSMKEAGARISIAVVDACRDNPLTISGGRSLGGTRGLQRSVGSARETKGTFSIYSAGYGQQALDRLPGESTGVNSVFTRVFVDQLTKPGMTLRRLAVEVKGEVGELVEKVGFEQDPAYYDGIKGRNAILFSSLNPSESPKFDDTRKNSKTKAGAESSERGLEIEFWNSVKSANSADLFEAYLKKYPDGAFAILASLQLQKLRSISVEKNVKPAKIIPKKNPKRIISKRYVSIGTGGVTGVYYPTGGAICRLVNKNRTTHGLRCSSESTGGSIYNINTIRAGQLEFGIAQSDWQHHAYHGTSKFRDRGPYKELRSVFSVHAEPITVIARDDSGIRNISDVRGKRFNIGNPGSGTRSIWNVLESAMGWKRSDLKLASGLTSRETSAAACDDKIDGFFWLVGHPSALTQESLAACATHLVNVTGPAIDKLIADYPYFRVATIPAGVYNNSEDITSFGVGATFVSSSDVPIETVYTLVKSVFENFEQFKRLHPAFNNLKPQEMIRDSLSAPLHAGAKKYYQEKGWM